MGSMIPPKPPVSRNAVQMVADGQRIKCPACGCTNYAPPILEGARIHCVCGKYKARRDASGHLVEEVENAKPDQGMAGPAFKLGDVVQLHSGGPAMTVWQLCEPDDDVPSADVCWIGDNVYHEEAIPLAALKLY